MPFPKPPSSARVKAARKRLRAKTAREVYAAVRERDGGRCRACHRFGGVWLEAHHIIYRSHGGPTTPDNLCMLHPWCHSDVHAGRLRITGSAEGELLFETLNREGERHATV